MNKEIFVKITSETKWHEIPLGGIIVDAGNAADFKTGDWRSMRPVWDEERCKHCLLCWVVCPDMSITVENGKMTGFDYDHCKGCGVCVQQCKFKALDFVPEE
ncbi:4Fe-4S binding protein [Clostridium thermarum]|uniref:4Fe-4S binding protein n=1 Tax=Clostridium thermarum TaxID=1716543 RepID=UPI00111CE482|nr:4Fe-4S binding protein [Clostridium thermarum]